jgi:hypothetical protein
MRQNNEAALAEDILDGMKEISEFLGQPERRTYYLAEKGLLDGVFKQGNRWVGLKSAIREGYARRSKCILPCPDEKIA